MTGVRAETVQSVPVRFVAAVCLTKREAFDACQALADADRFLLRAGQQEEARALGDLFELLEERLSARRPPGRTQATSGSKASDSEFTQYR